MYKKGDYVIKIPEDICEIEDVGCLDMSGVNKDKEYYALAPINQKGSKIYIPVHAFSHFEYLFHQYPA